MTVEDSSSAASAIAPLLPFPPMQSLEIPQLIKYSITPKDDGVLLCIWEPAPMTDTRVRPFLFMARYRLADDNEAKTVLEEYQVAYQALGSQSG
ncbi:MAG TPA: hypothetical protein V6C88_06625 [Chroococcidiopsis sp.]